MAGSEVKVDAAAYWVAEMDAALRFMAEVVGIEVADDGEELVSIEAAASAAGVPIELSRRPHAEGRPRIFSLRAGVVDPLLGAAEDFAGTGHTLLIEDAFRTREMQRDLAASEDLLRRLVDVVLRVERDPSADRVIDRLGAIVAPQPRSAGHMAGAAVDVTVLDGRGEPLDRGGPYLSVSEVMPMASPFISAVAVRNRQFVTEVMAGRGFRPYPYEFWHYSLDDAFCRKVDDAGEPARYGALDPGAGGGWVPAADPAVDLNPRAQLVPRLKALIAAARR